MNSKKKTYPLTEEQRAVILFTQRRRRAERKLELETTGTIAKVDRRKKEFRTGGYPRIHISHPEIVLNPIPRKKKVKVVKKKKPAPKPVFITAPKPKPLPKETRLPQSPKQTALRKERKPRPQASVCKIPTQDPTTTKTWIPELKMHVFLRPGQTAASVVAKYASRPGAKIGKF